MEIKAIETQNFKLDGGAMFGVVPKVLWQKKYPADQLNLCDWAMRCLFINDGLKKILIDTGMGNKQDMNFLRHYYLNGPNSLQNSFKKHGIKDIDITDVILTHLHFDHCGGSIGYNQEKTSLEPVFKNATYWVSEQQWNTANNPNKREKASFLPENFIPLKTSGQLKLINQNTDCTPAIRLKLFHGHTDGQIIPFVHYQNRIIVFTADLIPSTAHIPLPYIMSYDMQPLVTLEEKEHFLREAATENLILFFEHDIYSECCTVEKTSKGIRLAEKFTLEKLINPRENCN